MADPPDELSDASHAYFIARATVLMEDLDIKLAQYSPQERKVVLAILRDMVAEAWANA